jgi:hypothetical protein
LKESGCSYTEIETFNDKRIEAHECLDGREASPLLIKGSFPVKMPAWDFAGLNGSKLTAIKAAPC